MYKEPGAKGCVYQRKILWCRRLRIHWWARSSTATRAACLSKTFRRSRIKTGKPDKVVAVVFEATITPQVAPALYTVSESGHICKM